MNRRQFVKAGLLTAAIAPFAQFLSGCFGGGEVKPPEGTTACGGDNPTATALGYHANAETVDVQKFPKRAGEEGKKQLCNNCQFYTSLNEGWGNCQLIQGCGVANKGWCNSWVQKQGA